MTHDEWSVRRVLEWTTTFLKEQGSETARLDAEILLAHARHCPRIQLYTEFDAPLTTEERATMRNLVKRRAAAEPVAYLVGHKEFFSLDFLVDPHVLIPRPDTETLVMAALDVARTIPAPRILELCTGSGCIPVALAKNLPAAAVTTVEVSPEAAGVARANVEKHHLAERIILLQGDLFEPLPADARFDLIAGNPPYVRQDELERLDPDVRDHEPRLALDGGPDGLDVIRRIIAGAPGHLKNGGWLMLELSPEQSPAVNDLMQQRGFTNVDVKQDLAGRDRVAVGQMQTDR